MNELNQALLESALRWILTIFGGIMIKKGFADESLATVIVGGAPALAALAWSFLHKRQVESRVQTALYTPPPTSAKGPTPGDSNPSSMITPLLIVGLLIGSLCGCASAKRNAYTTLATIQTSVDAGMKVFAAAYINGRVSEIVKVKVFKAHDDYRASFKLAVMAAKADYQTVPPDDLVNMAKALVELINTATATGKAAQ